MTTKCLATVRDLLTKQTYEFEINATRDQILGDEVLEIAGSMASNEKGCQLDKIELKVTAIPNPELDAAVRKYMGLSDNALIINRFYRPNAHEFFSFQNVNIDGYELKILARTVSVCTYCVISKLQDSENEKAA